MKSEKGSVTIAKKSTSLKPMSDLEKGLLFGDNQDKGAFNQLDTRDIGE